MQFTVPQFIEKESKIVGPLSFKQFLFIAAGGAICFILYFSFGKTNFFLFILLTICIMGTAVALAFVNVAGKSLPQVIMNFFHFSLGPRIYIWQKKDTPLISLGKSSITLKKETKEASLKTEREGQLKKIKTYLETQTK